jgi:tRNA pseudouridine38-40 synthase
MRLAVGVEYDGSAFQGWQRLTKHGSALPDPTVQAVLEAALSRVANTPITSVCAGRTDAGVHGMAQVVHFDSPIARDPRGWMLGATANLPPEVCVRWCAPVAGDFHARFSARARRYRYTLVNRAVRPALGREQLSWERLPLDAEAMHRAAQHLLGENDFSAFRSVQCQATHARRDLQFIRVERIGERVQISVQANAFLHHMVRNIVGSLLVVGRGERDEDWIAELLAGRDRTVAGPTAMPNGLIFLGPLYEAHWGLPQEVTLPADMAITFRP